jgi:uncharacterized membrane protein YqaE (UPF0057 family)
MLRIIAVLCPPLAVAATGKFHLLPVSVFLTLSFYIPGLVHSQWVVSQYQAERRNAALLNAMHGFYG